MALGRVEEALPMLERAVAQWPQEYSLRQALQEATELQRAGAGASPGPSSAAAGGAPFGVSAASTSASVVSRLGRPTLPPREAPAGRGAPRRSPRGLAY